MAGISLALLGVVVLVVAIFALRQPKGASVIAGSISTGAPTSSSRPAASKSPAARSRTARRSTTTTTTPARTSVAPTGVRAVPLVVLNNTTTPNLARDAATRFKAGGWRVTSFGGLQNQIVSTCAYYDPNATNAKAAAEALQKQFPTIKRVVPKFSGLPAGPVVVVLTPDYSPN